MRVNELIIESEHPQAGRIREPRPAVRFEDTPSGLRLPAPRLGEHTDTVLAELGIDDRERARLRADGVIA